MSFYTANHIGKSGPYTAAHLAQNGPGDARPTALQIIADNDRTNKLASAVFLITGASGGVGAETGRAAAATGARVFLGVRDLKKGAEACKEFLEPGRVELLQLDVGSMASVRAGVKEFLRRSDKLNVLINNAGIMACPEAKTVDGFESQLAINYLGHFLLYKLLEPTLLASSTPAFHSRVVNVSSAGHQVSAPKLANMNLTNEYEPWVSYGSAKTACIWMTNEIERLHGGKGLHGISLMPGGIATELQRYIPEEQKKDWSSGEAVQRFWKSTAQGAATTMVAAVGREWEGKGGVYLEDCQVAGPVPEGGFLAVGVAEHAFDRDGEGKLWTLTHEMLGLEA